MLGTRSNDREFLVTISYLEKAKIRLFETPVWVPDQALAAQEAERALRRNHPEAIVFRVLTSDVVVQKMLKLQEVKENVKDMQFSG